METTLFRTEIELKELMDLRDNEELLPHEIEAIDQQIAEYCRREVRKVDGIHGYLGHCKMMAEAAALEAKRIQEYAQQWSRKADKLKEVVKYVMGAMNLTRLEGTTGQLVIKGNGGRRAVVITNPGLLPDELCIVKLEMPYKAWINRSFVNFNEQRCADMKSIYEELNTLCIDCGGTNPPEPCIACQGTGLTLVPGAVLSPRGNHLEVK